MHKRHLAVLAFLLTACGTETSVPRIAPAPTVMSAASVLADTHARLDAVGVLLTSCLPRLRGEPVDPADNCAKVMPDVASVIGEVEQKADQLPPAARAAISDVRKQLTEIEPCEPWFAAGGHSTDARLHQRCDSAWKSLFKSYSIVRNAA